MSRFKRYSQMLVSISRYEHKLARNNSCVRLYYVRKLLIKYLLCGLWKDNITIIVRKRLVNNYLRNPDINALELIADNLGLSFINCLSYYDHYICCFSQGK